MSKPSFCKSNLAKRHSFAFSPLSLAVKRGLGITAITLLPMTVATADIIVEQVSQGNGDYTQTTDLLDDPNGFPVVVNDSGGDNGTFTINSGVTMSDEGSSVFSLRDNALLDALVVKGTIAPTATGFAAIAGSFSSTIGTLTNSGTIQGNQDGQAAILARGTINTLNNTGTIEHTGSSTALIVNNATSITNDNEIKSNTGHAVVFGFNADANIGSFTNNGTISTNTSPMNGSGAEKAAIELGFGGSTATVNSLVNTGSISSANYDAIIMSEAGSSMGFTNSGTISAARHGLLVSNGTELTSFDNTGGTITSSGSGDAAALYLREDQDAAITNAGTLTNTSSGYGLWIDTEDQTQDFTNSGTISSTSGTAINADSAMTGSSNGFVNTGTITGGGGTAIDAEAAFKLTNSGTITGDINHATTGALTIEQSAGLITGDISSTADAAHSISLDGGSITGNISLDGTTANNLALNGATVAGNIDIGTGSINVNDDFTTGGALSGTTVNVASTKTLSLGHNISATTNNAGTISIAESETRTITGDYTQATSGVLKIGASSNQNFGKLVVTGTAALGNDAKFDVDVNSLNSLGIGQTLSSVVSASSVTGNNRFVVTDNSALFDFFGKTNGSDVDLSMVTASTVLESVVNSGLNSGIGVAAVFDDLNSSGGSAEMSNVITQLGQIATEKEVSDAVESTLPGISGGVSQLTNLATSAATDVIAARQDARRGLASGDELLAEKHVWFKPFGGWAEQDDRQGVTGYDMDSYGLALGFDSDITTTWNAGFALSYINSDVDSDLVSGSHNIDVDSYLVKAYATKMFDDVTALNLQLGGGFSNYDSSRRLFTNDVAGADYDSWQVQASAELERSYSISDKTAITPFVHADYSYVDVESYNETGAGALNLNVNDDSDDMLVIGAGVKANHIVSDSLLLIADAGIGYDVMTDRTSLTSSFAGGGAQFTTQGIEQDEWVYSAAVGAKYSLANGTEITARYDFNGRDNYNDQSVSANVRWMF